MNGKQEYYSSTKKNGMMVFVGQQMKQENTMSSHTIQIQNQKTDVVHFLSYMEERKKKQDGLNVEKGLKGRKVGGEKEKRLRGSMLKT